MEYSLRSLRSLEATGRPPGTGRSSLPLNRGTNAPKEREPGEGPADKHELVRDRDERLLERGQAKTSPTRRTAVSEGSRRDAAQRTDDDGKPESFGVELERQANDSSETRSKSQSDASAKTTEAHPTDPSTPSKPNETFEAAEPTSLSASDVVTPALEVLDTTTVQLPPEQSALPAQAPAMQVAGAPAPSPTVGAPIASAWTPALESADVDSAPLSALEPDARALHLPNELALKLELQATPQHGERPAFTLERTEPALPSAALAPESVPSDEPAPRVHDLERAADILRQVRVSISPEMRQATIQLSPLELGRISIRISLHEGRVSAHVRAERPEALEALQRHMPELRAAFEARGLQAQEFQLSLGFDGRERKHDAPTNGRTNPAIHGGSDHTPADLPMLTRALAQATSGIDTYA
jgi:flagellar hook-length control protein FliK